MESDIRQLEETYQQRNWAIVTEWTRKREKDNTRMATWEWLLGQAEEEANRRKH